MKENSDCTDCDLWVNATPGSVCLKGEGGMKRGGLLIFLDSPNMIEDRRHRGFVSDAAELLRWMLARMSISKEDYYLEYVIKCYAKCKAFGNKANRIGLINTCSQYRFATLQSLRPAAIIGMGSVCCETFIGSNKVSDFEGSNWTPIEPRVRDFVEHVWITYSPAYAIQDAAESVGIYRTLERAASDAGLKPRLDKTIKNQKLFELYGT